VRWAGATARGSVRFALTRVVTRHGEIPGFHLAFADSLPASIPLAAGTYRLDVGGSHVRPSRQEFEVRSGEATPLDVPLASGMRTRFRFVTEPPGAPLGRVRIVIRRLGESIVLHDGVHAFQPGADAVAEIEAEPAAFELEAVSESGLLGTLRGWLMPTCEPRVLDVPMGR
jgi:hypothetical protein